MHGDGWLGEHIDHVVSIVRAECPDAAPRDRQVPSRPPVPRGPRPLPHLALCHRERAGRMAVVMEAGALPGEPGQQPYLAIVGQFEPLIPAPNKLKAHHVAPAAGPRRPDRLTVCAVPVTAWGDLLAPLPYSGSFAWVRLGCGLAGWSKAARVIF